MGCIVEVNLQYLAVLSSHTLKFHSEPSVERDD